MCGSGDLFEPQSVAERQCPVVRAGAAATGAATASGVPGFPAALQ